MDIRGVFGRNLRRWRKAAHLSQEALAVRMGVDRSHVSAMERGRQNVTLITLWHVSRALDVEPMQLLDLRTSAGAVPAIDPPPQE